MKKLPETITEEEFNLLIKNTKKPHHKLAFCFGFYQGMRISEIINIREENIDWGQKIIRIKQGKGGKDRNIPIMPEFYPILRRERAKIPIKCGVRALEIAFKAKLKLAGINRALHFHNLRHSSATWLLNKKKWDVRFVQQFLGHSRLDTTQIYTIVTPQNLLEMAWGKDA